MVTVKGNVHRFQKKSDQPCLLVAESKRGLFPVFWEKAGQLAKCLEACV